MKDEAVTPLYKKDQWQRWVALFADSDCMTPTFDEWFSDHVDMVRDFKRRGITVHEVEVDIDDYVAWTRASSLPINGKTRTDYPIHVLIERMKDAGDFES